MSSPALPARTSRTSSANLAPPQSRKLDRGDYFLFLFICLASLAVTYFFRDSILASVISFTGFVIAILATTKLDIAHPIVWFLPAFGLYTIGAPVVVLMDMLPYNENYGRVVFLHQIGAVTFLICVGPRVLHLRQLRPIGSNGVAAKVVILLGLLVIMANVYAVMRSGAVGKRDIRLVGGSLGAASFGPTIVQTGFVLLFVGAATRSGKSRRADSDRARLYYVGGIAIFLLFLMVFFVTGQRKIVFGLFVILIILRHVFIRRVTPPQLVTALLLLILAVPFAAWNKNLVLRLSAGEAMYREHSMARRELFVHTLWGEFRSSGENMSILLDYLDRTESFRWGQGTAEEIATVALPNFMRTNRASSAQWFNHTFFAAVVDQGGAQGFSMVGFGYLEAGTAGVILLFAALALLTRWIYARSVRSGTMLVIYICFAIIFVSALRQSFAVVLSPLIKHVLVPIAIGFAVEKAARWNSRVRSRLPTPGLPAAIGQQPLSRSLASTNLPSARTPLR